MTIIVYITALPARDVIEVAPECTAMACSRAQNTLSAAGRSRSAAVGRGVSRGVLWLVGSSVGLRGDASEDLRAANGTAAVGGSHRANSGA